MKPSTQAPPAKHPPAVLAVGCARCWAAGYCAAYAPASPAQPPSACPLLPPLALGPR